MFRRHFITALATGLVLRPIKGLAALGEDPPLSFFVLGDWGTGGSLQKKVAGGMRSASAIRKPSFVLSTGDNIYPNGVSSALDPQWVSKYEKIYEGLDVPWWSILGNHDHRGDPDAQVAYGRRNPLWNMPGRTWSKEFAIDSVTKVSLTALDTTPLLQKQELWKTQLEWLDQTLSESKAQRHIVAGHHPLRSYGHYGDTDFLVKNVKPILDRHNVLLYCCGHDHDLQAIKNPDDVFGCLVSGGGGGSRVTSSGVNTKASATGGGFARVAISARACTVVIHDATGLNVGEMTL
ncbi:MAG: metallophosphoesterase [Candidatus Kapabacteria bacterium]|nr:metallophosphoesterase [Candidatus Kapabacteria bacterium]